MSASFIETRWTLVRRASQGDAAGAVALSDLCEIYYRPVCSFLTRRTGDADSGRELAHAFFEEILERPSSITAESSKGRFRSYLLGAVKHFLSRRKSHENAEKRGGGAVHLTLEDQQQPDEDSDLFDREWAYAVVASSLGSLRKQMEESGKVDHYEVLKPWLVSGGTQDYSKAAAALEMGEPAVRVAVHRLRQRYRECVRDQIRDTVGGEAEVEEEFRYLISIVSG